MAFLSSETLAITCHFWVFAQHRFSWPSCRKTLARCPNLYCQLVPLPLSTTINQDCVKGISSFEGGSTWNRPRVCGDLEHSGDYKLLPMSTASGSILLREPRARRFPLLMSRLILMQLKQCPAFAYRNVCGLGNSSVIANGLESYQNCWLPSWYCWWCWEHCNNTFKWVMGSPRYEPIGWINLSHINWGSSLFLNRKQHFKTFGNHLIVNLRCLKVGYLIGAQNKCEWWLN